MGINIRKIEERDFKELVALFHEFAAFEKLADMMTNSLEQMLEEKEYLHGYVATNDEHQIIGYVTLFFSYYTWFGKSLYMDDLYVKQDYRGKGIGTMLINKAIDYAKEHKYKKLLWQVSEWNTPAREFYKNLGATINTVEQNCDIIF